MKTPAGKASQRCVDNTAGRKRSTAANEAKSPCQAARCTKLQQGRPSMQLGTAAAKERTGLMKLRATEYTSRGNRRKIDNPKTRRERREGRQSLKIEAAVQRDKGGWTLQK